ncbi:MAG: bifunctional glutamate N-acetyltransferase/amino-acid acetyltransferase ArgJ [Candidatus Omnitrophota bacterium]
MKIIKGSVAAPKGFFASGIHCGIKKKGLDLALIFSGVPAVAAGVWTTNSVKAAPVLLTEANLKDSCAQAIIANSGNANCMNGKAGVEWAKQTAASVSGALCIDTDDVLVASTGIIGKPLPAAKIIGAVPQLAKSLSRNGGIMAAKAIMTTDLVVKEVAASLSIAGKTVRIGAIAKGSGMIYPNMATMLCFITTDAYIESAALKASLKAATEKSFNMVTVDGDMSTNDTVLLLANGMAMNPLIRKGSPDYMKFCSALDFLMISLAKSVARDGEGASKFIEVNVTGAKSTDEARKVAMEIANSNLVKTAVAGEDPNVGRIASSAGASGVKFDASKLNISLNGVRVVCSGSARSELRAAAKKQMKKKEVLIGVDLGSGKASATAWTCDLTERYIKINARYN